MNDDRSRVLPCLCADNAPREVRCHQEGIEISEALASTSKRILKRLTAFKVNSTEANALRAREAYVAGLEANQVFLARCRACIDFNDDLGEIEGAITDYSAKITEIDDLLTAHGSTRASEQELHAQREQRRRNAATARKAYRVSRRAARWIKRF